MKRLLIIALLILHTAASSGTVLSLHYCMGSFASLSVGEKHGTGCDTCGMEDKGCCHDDVKIIKIDGTQKLISTTNDFFPRQLFLLSEQPYSLGIQPIAIDNLGFRYYPVQQGDGPPIFLLNCNFRI